VSSTTRPEACPTQLRHGRCCLPAVASWGQGRPGHTTCRLATHQDPHSDSDSWRQPAYAFRARTQDPASGFFSGSVSA
jgi:hypothetical protein